MLKNLLRQLNFATLVALVWLLVALALLLQHWAQTAETPLDTDDAMRLVEPRAWLAGNGLLAGWFDLHQPAAAPLGYDAHWSRLIDAGLAGLLLILKLAPRATPRCRACRRAWW
jgi:hypothetical protein